MARLDYFVVAQNISVDQTTNAVSAFNIVEELRSPGFPVLVPSLAVLSVWHREEGDQEQDFQCTLRVTPPGEIPQDFHTNFRLLPPRHRLIHRLQGLPILRAGDIHFEILLNGAVRLEYIVPAVQDASLPAG